ncbi:glycosyltransferase family 4 protein [Aestuariivirga sp.]|uniref:glycosyltransferase family 4 protein n=1 Tax=Aestuariivirga sp. TaxID=2650926 RepID=UPI00391B1966
MPGFLLCLTYHLPNVSGLTLSAHELARHLASRGHKLRVVAGRVPDTAPALETIDDVEVVRVRSLCRISKALVMPGYGLAVWRAMDGMAVVNVQLPCLDAGLVAVLAKLRGRKLIVSYISSMSKATIGARILRALAAVPHVAAGILADRIQVVSPDYAEASTFCRLFRRKIDFAPLPVHLHLLPGETHPPRRPRTADADRPFRIGYVGRVARQKSLGLLLAALPRIVELVGPHVVLDIVGPASDVIGESHWHEILEAANASGGRVRYCGSKSGMALARHYAELDVLVLPSTDRLESFGLVQVEAMLRRVPVVASDLPGMRLPIARTGMGRLFPAGDAAALAEAVAKVLADGPPCDPGPDEIERLFGNEAACTPYARLLAAGDGR